MSSSTENTPDDNPTAVPDGREEAEAEIPPVDKAVENEVYAWSGQAPGAAFDPFDREPDGGAFDSMFSEPVPPSEDVVVEIDSAENPAADPNSVGQDADKRDAPDQHELEAVRILVIGSYAFEGRGTVLEPIQKFWNEVDNAPLTVLVGGCPAGPEGMLMQIGPSMDMDVRVLRDEEIAHSGAVAVFAFIRDKSEGAERALAIAIAAGIPVKVFREDAVGGNTGWTTR